MLTCATHPSKANVMYRCHFTRKGPIVGGNDLTAATLEAAIEERVPYLDVCDDTEWSQRAKALHSRAQVRSSGSSGFGFGFGSP